MALECFGILLEFLNVGSVAERLTDVFHSLEPFILGVVFIIHSNICFKNFLSHISCDVFGHFEVVIKKLETDKDFCVRVLGDKAALPEKLRNKCIEVENMAKDKPFVCNVALNYGGRDEIVHAANEAIKAGYTELTEEILAKFMYTADTPDPDLVIRTGGDFRISNFLLWQSAYSEFVVLDTLWPDFKEKEIDESVRAFYSRKRRFGGLDKEDAK